MSQSGPEIHQQLMDGYRAAQTRLDEMREQVNSDGSKRDLLADERSDTLVALAEFYLPALTPETIRDTWRDVQPTIKQILTQKLDHQARLDYRLNEISQQRDTHEATLLEINREIDTLSASSLEIAQQVEQRISNDEQFATLSDRAAIAEAALERAEANLDEVEQDAAKKLPAYEDSALFSYLKNRNFGTNDYEHGGFSRRMDRMLAKFIGYRDAKNGYDFLTKTPDQMRKVIAEDRDALNTVMAELERRRDEVAEELGLQSTLSELKGVEKTREQLLSELESELAEFYSTQDELCAMEDARGPHYKQAITVFREMLERFSTRELERRAKSTSDLSDDQIVSRLRGVDQAVDRLDEYARKHRRSIDQQQAYVIDFGRLMQKFRSARFDSQRSQFSRSLDMQQALESAQNSYDTRYLWERMRSAHRWGPTMVERVTDVASHPLTQILISAMAHAATGNRRHQARRAGERRARSRFQIGDSSGDWLSPWTGDSSKDFRRKRRR